MGFSYDIKNRVAEILAKQGYASARGLMHLLESTHPDLTCVELRTVLDEMCKQGESTIGRISEEVAKRSLLESDVYYSIAWLSRQDRHDCESVGDIVGKSLYRTILDNGWFRKCEDQCDSWALAKAHLEHIMMHAENSDDYAWWRFLRRYANWNRDFLEGLAHERRGEIAEAKAAYEKGRDARCARSMYRLAKLLAADVADAHGQGRSSCHLATAIVSDREHPLCPRVAETVVELLQEACWEYLPAAYFLSEIERATGSLKGGRCYKPMNYLEVFCEYDDEVALCLAKMYHEGWGKPVCEIEAFRYAEEAAAMDNVEAAQLVQRWRQEEERARSEDLLSGALALSFPIRFHHDVKRF